MNKKQNDRPIRPVVFLTCKVRAGILYMLDTDGLDIAIMTLITLSKSSTVSSPFASYTFCP